MGTLYLKENDTEPDSVIVLKDPDDSVHVLDGTETCTLHVELDDQARTKLQFALTISNAAGGQVTWEKTAADWGTGKLVPGLHKLEVEVVTVGGADRLTFPNDGYDELDITPHLGDS